MLQDSTDYINPAVLSHARKNHISRFLEATESVENFDNTSCNLSAAWESSTATLVTASAFWIFSESTAKRSAK